MDPALWSTLPFDLLERIASFAEADSRRALGFLPRRLPPLPGWWPPFRPGPAALVHRPEERTLIHLCCFEYGGLRMEVFSDITRLPDGGDDTCSRWATAPGGCHREVLVRDNEARVFDWKLPGSAIHVAIDCVPL